MISNNSYSWVWKLERNETLHIHVQHGKLLQRVQYRSHPRRQSSRMGRMVGQKYGQLVTTLSDTTVNSSHNFAAWRADSVTSLLVPYLHSMSWNERWTNTEFNKKLQ